MKVIIRLQGDLRRHVSSDSREIELTDGATVADAIAALGIRPGEVWLARLDEELVDKDHVLQAGDELSLIPPVAGGQLLDNELDQEIEIDELRLYGQDSQG